MRTTNSFENPSTNPLENQLEAAREMLPDSLAQKLEEAEKIVDAIDRGTFDTSELTAAEQLRENFDERADHQRVEDLEHINEVRENLSHQPEVNVEIGPSFETPDDAHETRLPLHGPNPELSRREFIHNTAFAGIGGFFRKLGFGGKDKNESAEHLERDPRLFNEGILDLHEKSLKDINETEMMYIRGTDGKEQWVESTKHTGETSAMSDLDKITEVLKSKPAEISFNHTHPVNMIRAGLEIEEVSTEGAEDFPNPPSTLDLAHAYGVSVEARKISPKTKLTFGAVEQNGVWTFEIKDGSYYKEMQKFQVDLVNDLSHIIEKEPKLKEKLARGADGTIDPRAVAPTALAILQDPTNIEQGVISAKSAAKLEKILTRVLPQSEAAEAYEELCVFEKLGLNQKPEQELKGTPKEKRDMLLKAYKEKMRRYMELVEKTGAKVTFTPISNFKNKK